MTHWWHQSPNPNSLYLDKRGSQLVHSFNSLITTTTSSNKPTQPTNKNKFCSESLSNNQSDLASLGASGVNLFEQETSRRTIWTVTVSVLDLQPELDQISPPPFGSLRWFKFSSIEWCKNWTVISLWITSTASDFIVCFHFSRWFPKIAVKAFDRSEIWSLLRNGHSVLYSKWISPIVINFLVSNFWVKMEKTPPLSSYKSRSTMYFLMVKWFRLNLSFQRINLTS